MSKKYIRRFFKFFYSKILNWLNLLENQEHENIVFQLQNAHKEEITVKEKRQHTVVERLNFEFNQLEERFGDLLHKNEKLDKHTSELEQRIEELLKFKDLFPVKNKLSGQVINGDSFDDTSYNIERFKHEIDYINRIESHKKTHEQSLIYVSEEQEKMLYTNNTATNVIAGAGSGKSTMMVLRVIYLLRESEARLSNFAICTFTNDSRDDFVDKLYLRLTQFGEEVEPEQIKKHVRTLHSLALHVYKDLSGYFPNLLFNGKNKNKNKKAVLNGSNNPQLLGNGEYQEMNQEDIDDIDNPLVPENSEDLTLGIVDKTLAAAYKTAYSNDKMFREYINKLCILALKQQRSTNAELTNYEGLVQYESPYRIFCLKYWLDYKLKSAGVNSSVIEKYIIDKQFRIHLCDIKVHLYIESIDTYIILDLTKSEIAESKVEEAWVQEQKQHIGLNKTFWGWRFRLIRQNYLINHTPSEVVLIETVQELQELIQLSEIGFKSEFDYEDAPSFDYLCQGDISSKKSSAKRKIYHSFYSYIQYAASNCINVSKHADAVLSIPFLDRARLLRIDNIKKLSPSHDRQLYFGDLLFLSSLCIFSRYFESELTFKSLVTFDHIFEQLGDPDSLIYKKKDINYTLSYMRYFFIDEYQDISPNILRAFKVVKMKLNGALAHDERSSWMSIGDDEQSIYGWRGSSPSIINEFGRYLELSENYKQITLEANQRCSDLILKPANEIIALGKFKSQKISKPVERNIGRERDGFWSSHLPRNQYGQTRDCYFKVVFDLIEKEINYLKLTNKKPLFLLFRSSSSLPDSKNSQEVKWYKKQQNLVKSGVLVVSSIHSSKGLESSSVIILGDMKKPKPHPVKSYFYTLSGLPDTYESCQIDEMYRLGYVAVTRAKHRCFWLYSSEVLHENMAYEILTSSQYKLSNEDLLNVPFQ